jgi:TDG/mug DNA glycosylase family protein
VGTEADASVGFRDHERVTGGPICKPFRVMDRATVDVYDANVGDWIEHRRRARPPSLDAFAARVRPGVRADVGCGPGWHSGDLGLPVVAMDAAAAMAAQVRTFAPDAWPLVADLEQLPLRTGSLTGAWAHKSYMHIAAEALPMALADLHRSLAADGALHIQVTSDRKQENEDDRFPGRHFTWWPPQRLRDVVEGAGFTIDAFVDDGEEWIDVEGSRALMLPDTVGPDMRALIVGLNPSVLSAERGVGFARPGNRFWPAATQSGLVTRALDPFRALRIDRVGMTNLVRRATVSAKDLTRAEYVDGAQRLERLVRWLRPACVVFVGVTGYRLAVDKTATIGWQPSPFGGVGTYVMPNTSGLNAHAKPADFAAHVAEVVRAT